MLSVEKYSHQHVHIYEKVYKQKQYAIIIGYMSESESAGLPKLLGVPLYKLHILNGH